MKIKQLIPFLLLFNAGNAQFKAEANLKNLDLKSKHLNLAVRDTFGLKDMINIKGNAKLKYNNNYFYFNRNGLLNHSYGFVFEKNNFNWNYHKSDQNFKKENTISQDSPIGKITTKTTLLNDQQLQELGFKASYYKYSLEYKKAKENTKVNIEILIDINGEKDLSKIDINLNNYTEVYGFYSEDLDIKYIYNRGDSINFDNFLVTFHNKNLNLFYGEELGFLIGHKLWKNLMINLVYDKKFKVNLSSLDYSQLIKEEIDNDTENRLRLVKKNYNEKLENKKDYLKDMFFTQYYGFSFDIFFDRYNPKIKKENIQANLNLKYILLHYSDNNKKIGLKYKSALASYDIDKKEIMLGVWLK